MIKFGERRRPMIKFGERIFFRPIESHMGHKKNDYMPKVLAGHYVGTQSRNADVLGMTTQGVIRGASVHRRPEPERLDASEVPELKGVPWDPKPEDTQSFLPLPVALPDMECEPRQRAAETAPRKFHITKQDFEDFQITPGCQGCAGYSPVCTERIKQRLEETEKGRVRLEKYKRKIGENGDEDIEMRPDPDAGEIPASEALGKPVEEEPSMHQ